jgi:hypothetical protein
MYLLGIIIINNLMSDEINLTQNDNFENSLLELIFNSTSTDNVLLQRFYLELLNIGRFLYLTYRNKPNSFD